MKINFIPENVLIWQTYKSRNGKLIIIITENYTGHKTYTIKGLILSSTDLIWTKGRTLQFTSEGKDRENGMESEIDLVTLINTETIEV